jgi:hypothetical protein
MRADEVTPQKWLWDDNYPIRILYDDGDYSVIWGKYENIRALGVRWNGGTDIGYPGQGAHPTWYVEPDFIAINILQRILTLAIDNKDKEHLNDIHFAIRELTDKMTPE